MDISDKLFVVNARLKAELVGVTIGSDINRLHLRGTLPPKPNSTQAKPF